MANKSDETEVVKIQPYPFLGEFQREGFPAIQIQIVRLTEVGFLFKSSGHLFLPNQNYKVQFELPVFKKVFNEDVKIIKTYETVNVGGVAGAVDRTSLTVEAHFKTLPRDKFQEIKEFISKIKQS